MRRSIETDTLRKIQVALSREHCRVFRNNVGVAVYPDGSRVRYGLAPGSSDLIGWSPVIITPRHVGRQVAVFTAIEVKAIGKPEPTEQQENFIQVVQDAGGISGVAMSADEAIILVDRFKL